MKLVFDESQDMLRGVARDFLAEACPIRAVRAAEADSKGYSPDLWRRMAELGWLGVPLPGQYGGAGAGLEDLAVLSEETGRALVPAPFMDTLVLGALSLLDAGTDEQKELLPRLARGELILSAALLEPEGDLSPSGIQLRALPSGNAFVLDGAKLFARYADSADYLICAVRTRDGDEASGVSLLLVDLPARGITVRAVNSLAGEHFCEIDFQGVEVPSKNLVGALDHGWEVLERPLRWATILQCCEIIGAAERVLEMMVDFAGSRVQFGRPIGAFQAVQHKCVNVLRDLEGARAATYAAVAAASEGTAPGELVAGAKGFANMLARNAAYEGHQVFAAIGFMEEHDMQLYSRRLKSMELRLGSVDTHRLGYMDIVTSGRQYAREA